MLYQRALNVEHVLKFTAANRLLGTLKEFEWGEDNLFFDDIDDIDDIEDDEGMGDNDLVEAFRVPDQYPSDDKGGNGR